jgi:hypothetical protein
VSYSKKQECHPNEFGRRKENVDKVAIRPVNHYQVDPTGGPNQVYLSGLRDSEWLA